jgi:sporulation protein YlmC with PRC-barrel domain
MTNAPTTYSVISSAKVEGSAVYNPERERLGSIDDLMIDKRSGQVRYAVLEFGGILGIGTDKYPLPWDTMHYDIDLDGYVVSVAKEQLKNAPRYADDRSPEYTPEFGRTIYDYYSIPWYL